MGQVEGMMGGDQKGGKNEGSDVRAPPPFPCALLVQFAIACVT